ncbi:MAG: Gfo/Idh/MocA family oxidoreductase [Verrucomicrobiota bacterium]|nr:Gfo/Idh/MocA family oxidoreductase [Verrucomicrobiota bacterium]
MNPNAPLLQQRSLWRLVQRRLRDYFPGQNGSASSRRIGVGLIGVGNVASWQHLPKLRDSHRGFQLKAVYDIAEARAQSIAAEFSVTCCDSLTVLVRRDDVEAVVICTPTQAHVEGVLAALHAKKHVLCEKPLGQTSREAHQMWAASREAGVVNMVDFSYRFRPDFTFVGRLIRTGMLGQIYHMWGSISQGQWFTESAEPSAERPDAALWKFGPGGGVIRDLGPHVLDLVRCWFGEIRCVQAWMKPVLRGAAGAEAACGMMLTFDSGAVAQLLTSRLETGVKEQTFLDIAGSRGALRLEHGVVKLWTVDSPRWRTLLLPLHVPDVLNAFYRAIIDPTAERPSFWDGLKNNEALDAVLISAERAVSIPLPLGPDGNAWPPAQRPPPAAVADFLRM